MIKLLQLPPCPSCGLCGLAWADHFSQLLSQICLPSLSIFLLFGLPFERETDVTKSEIQRPPHRSADIEEEDFISSGARPRPFSEDMFLLLPTSQLKPVKQPEISLRYLPLSLGFLHFPSWRLQFSTRLTSSASFRSCGLPPLALARPSARPSVRLSSMF